MKTVPQNSVNFFQKNLLFWFSQNQRPLPWRQTYDPYHVWISEIMLQQTQVKTVLPYFDRWIKALPSIQAVAEADEETILKLWEGLGYYSRARNLHRAAKALAEHNGGRMYENFDDILSLPGIGKYTAGAIASIAFNQDHPVADGNVIRVLARLLNVSKNAKEQKNIKFFWKKAEALLPKGRAREFNQGMMELGALICTPHSPKCDECPLQKQCAAYKADTQDRVPNLGKRAKAEAIQVAVAVIRKGDEVFVQKRTPNGLMGGLWEFPGGKIEPRETAKQALAREIQEETGIKIKNLKFFLNIKHSYTRFKVDLHCFLCEYRDGAVKLTAATDYQWVKVPELKKLAFPAANGKIIEALLH